MATPLRGIQNFFRLVWNRLAGLNSGSSSDLTGRAPRHEVLIPMSYRLMGQATWREAEMRNISQSGILFRCVEPLPEGTHLEITFRSALDDTEQPTEVFFFAWTVRTRLLSASGSRAEVAARVRASRSTATPPLDVREVVGEYRGPCAGSRFEWPSVAGAVVFCAMPMLSTLAAWVQHLFPNVPK